MFKNYSTIEYTLRGPVKHIIAREQPVPVCKLTKDVDVFGFSDMSVIPYGSSYTLRYSVNTLPQQPAQVQFLCTVVVRSETDIALVESNTPFTSVLGNYLPSSSKIAYLNSADNVIYTSGEPKTGCVVFAGAPALGFTQQQCNTVLYAHAYNVILSTPLLKHSVLHPQLPSIFSTSTEIADIPETGLIHRLPIPQKLIQQGCPTEWRIYPPRILIKSKGRYYTYTTDWTEVAPPITIDTLMTKGMQLSKLNELNIPDEMYMTRKCNAHLQSVAIHYVEVISVGWIFRMHTTASFWREIYPAEYLIWPKYNGAFWVFLCGELQ